MEQHHSEKGEFFVAFKVAVVGETPIDFTNLSGTEFMPMIYKDDNLDFLGV